MTTIGIDLGTTTISAVVYAQGDTKNIAKEFEKGSDGETGKVLEAKTVQGKGFLKASHEWERLQEPEEIVCQAQTLLDELLMRYPETSAIGLTGQMHGIVYIDKEGKSIGPLYTWQDGRGNLPVPAFDSSRKSLVEWVYDETGMRVSSGYGLVTHLYHSQKEIVPPNSAGICTIADYFGLRLTGRGKPLMHISNGASLGFFDSKRGVFREDVLKELGMDTSILPELVKDFSLLGTYKGIPVTVAIGDSQASFLGTVGRKENTVLLNVGTGSQISILSGQYFEAPGIEARPLAEGSYLLTGSSLCGGRAYAILERFLRNYAREAGAEDVPQYDIMGRLAEKGRLERNGKEKQGMKVATTFSGTRVLPELRGSITGIGEDNFTPEGLIYGVLEGMAQELFDFYKLIREGTGFCAEHLMASGNGVRMNPTLQKILSNLFGAELTLAPHQEEAACGAAISAELKTANIRKRTE